MWHMCVIAALTRSMWAALALSTPLTAVAGSGSDACAAVETRSNSLLQTNSVRGLLKIEDADEPGWADEDGPDPASEAYADAVVFDSDMHSKSASNSWGSHLQKIEADVVSTSSVSALRSHMAYQSYLRRAMDTLERSRNASSQELENLIDSFIAAHTASTDHCPAELMEAKHQLNDLHQHILSVASSVKALQNEIQQNEQKKSKANDDLKTAKEQHDETKSKIADEKEEARKFLAQLKAEMAELRKIAQPDTKMNITAATLGTSGGQFSSMLQVWKPGSPEVKDALTMMAQTKSASSELLSCLQRSSTAALLENRIRNQATLLQVQKSVEDQRQEAADSALAGAWPNCTVNQSVSVAIGNVTSAILSPAAIANKTYRSHHCSNVNDKYGGTIWLHCMNGVLSADARGCLRFPNQAQCVAQRKHLEDTYVKAYVGIARLIDKWEKKVADKASEEAAKQKFDDSADPSKQDAEDAEGALADKTKKLQDLRSKVQDAWNAEKKLQGHIIATAKTCVALGNSTQYLADVRDAIHALEACPGLARAEFHIPSYQGEWVSFTLDNTSDDQTIDAAMEAACVAKFGAASRAAEVSEIEGQSIEGAPETNTGTLPLLGKCPDCEGGSNADTGTYTATGHARICWFPGKPLDLASREGLCYMNMKAVMCVSDRGDVRKLAGFATMPPTTNTSL